MLTISGKHFISHHWKRNAALAPSISCTAMSSRWCTLIVSHTLTGVVDHGLKILENVILHVSSAERSKKLLLVLKNRNCKYLSCPMSSVVRCTDWCMLKTEVWSYGEETILVFYSCWEYLPKSPVCGSGRWDFFSFLKAHELNYQLALACRAVAWAAQSETGKNCPCLHFSCNCISWAA